MRRIDYDTEQYQDYARGRALTEPQLQAWISAFADLLPGRRPLVDAALFQPLHEVIATFTSAGWRVASFGTVTEPSSGTRGETLQRLRLRTHSTFALFTPDELETGFRRLEQAIAADPGAPAPEDPATLLTLERR